MKKFELKISDTSLRKLRRALIGIDALEEDQSDENVIQQCFCIETLHDIVDVSHLVEVKRKEEL